MRRLRSLFIVSILLTSAACTLSSSPITPTPASVATLPPITSGQPTVTIESPEEGTEVEVGNSVLVSATATDSVGVTSVQLFANDQLVKTVSSEAVEGDVSLPVVMDYNPRNTGEVILEVIAYRDIVASNPASITITVAEETSSGGNDNGNSGVGNPGGNGGNSGGDGGIVINPNDPTCRILTNVALNYRIGPGTDYQRIGTFGAGQQVPIVGRLGDNSWWQVQTNSFQRAWVSSAFTTEYGNCFSVPIVAAPPTPTSSVPTQTPIPTSTFTPVPTATHTASPPPPTPTASLPDLVITNIDGPEEMLLDEGATVVNGTFSFQITNTGGSSTGRAFESEVRLLPSDEIIDLGVVGELSPGESILLRQALSFDTRAQYTVQAQADSTDVVNEASEVNNIASLVVNVTGGN